MKKFDVTGFSVGVTGRTCMVRVRGEGNRDEWELPEVLGVLDAPENIAAGACCEGWGGGSVRVMTVERGVA